MNKMGKIAGNCFRPGRALTGLFVAAALFLAGCPNPASGGDDDDPPALGDARLASLVVEPGNLSPAFCPDKTDYVMNAAHTLEDISIEGEPLEADARVEGGGTHSLEVGGNIFPVKVTTSAGLEKIYRITVNRADPSASANAELASLSIEPGALDRPFEPHTRQYQAVLPNSVDSITVNALAREEKATLSGAGTWALEVGLNSLEIIVTAPAGNYAVYKLQVRRSGPEAGGSDDAGLASLKLMSETGELVALDIADVNGVYEYNAGVETAAVSLEILAAASGAAATFTVDPPGAWNGGEILLYAETTLVAITVTAGDGETKRLYSITINRPEKSSDAALAELSLEDLPLDPPFDPGVFLYAAAAPSAYSRPSVTALANHRLAEVDVESPDYLVAGEPGTIKVTVTPETGDPKIYTITVTRARDTDANLVSLEASAGSLSPVFSANTLEYDLDVPNSVGSLTITAAPSSAVAAVDDAPRGESKTHTLTLTPGVTAEAVFTVTAESGFAKTYRVNAVRRYSGNNKLSALGFTAGTLAGTLEPPFDPAVSSYKAFLMSDTGSFAVDVTATADDAGATVDGAGPLSLETGGNLVPVRVTAANGVERIYNILIICEPGLHVSSSLAAMREFLETQEANTADSPYGILLNGQTGFPTRNGVWGTSLGIPGTAKISGGRDNYNTFSTRGTIYLYEDFKGKYVALDMSGSSGLEMIFHTILTEATNQAANRALLVAVVLPPALTQIGEYAFAGCSNLASVTLKYEGGLVDLKQRTQYDTGDRVSPIVRDLPAEELNAVGSTQFAGVPDECVFYVPENLVAAYQNSPVWSYIKDSQFQAIVED
ncbi:MAG: cadherin-like beta sandwich domain-containing protein [Treponema sp.]|jgi:hypothetical protein|nr:cadherin-like beta sandwich domain-containing protein [Treponema sp.]